LTIHVTASLGADQPERLCVCKWRGKMPSGRGQENAALVLVLPVLKIYSAHNVYYRFPVLEVNIRNIDMDTWTADWGGDRDTRGI